MSKADIIFKENIRKILNDGIDDTDFDVRPKWSDGTEAHTRKVFGIVNRYNLKEEFPILTLRKINWKAALDEILWIWQKHSNNVNDLNSHIWDSWADETGSIGKAYGYQLGKVIDFGHGEKMNQVDKILKDLTENPASRRIITNLYNIEELKDMALAPCCYSCTFNVSGNTLNMLLNQRSQDMITANNWNVCQYAMLLHMIARHTGLEAGELVHVIADAHIYDRHIPIAERLLEKEGFEAPKLTINSSVKNFYDFSVDDFSFDNYKYDDEKFVIPVAI